MIKVDLITGFLGSGKTTFIKKYAEYFTSQGQRIGIIENDYGAVNVDMMLLKSLRSDNLEIEMVAGACDFDCHMRRFKSKLIALAMQKFDRVIIEPSGIFDVDEFFDVIADEPLDKWYEVGNVIALVDSRLEDSLSDAADYYLASQIANAGAVLLTKSSQASEENIASVREHLERAKTRSKLFKDIGAVTMSIDSPNLSEEELSKISKCGYKLCSFVKLMNKDQTDFSTLYYLDKAMSSEDVRNYVKILFEDEKFGKVFRIKGFFRENDAWYQVNATSNETVIEEIPDGQQVLIVIGENLVKSQVDALLS